MNTQPKIKRHWISSLFFTLLLLVTHTGFASDDKGIEFFDGTLAEAQALAIEQQKPIFVQLSATWCLPCRQMEKYVFPLSSVGSFYNSNFISLKVDADSFDGIELKQSYNIRTIPESLFFGSNGRLILQEGGFKGEQDILNLGNQILKKHPKARKPVKKEKVKKEKKAKTKKVKKAKKSKFSSEEVNNLYEQKSSFNLFWLRLTGQIKQPRNMKWVYHNAENFGSKAMDILLRQKSHYAKHYGETAVNDRIKSILYTKLAIATGDKNEYLF
ncbi:MAG: thioredoxin family protein, partial [Chitinophagales bacterium]